MATSARILLIDDDAGRRAAIRAALATTNFPFTLIDAADAAAGLALAASETFDCVLLDGDLPGAVDALGELAPEEGGRPVIALTNGAGPAPAFLRGGAFECIARAEADPENLARAIGAAKARGDFVASLRAARNDAEAKARALERSNRQKTLILSIIAHDLRNPLQVLLGMSQLLAEMVGGSDPATISRRAATVHEAANQAHGLVESLFSWAGLLMEGQAAEPAPIEVDTLLIDSKAALQERADAKGIVVEAVPSASRVLSQPDAVAAILRNLVANALKFTAPGGHVTLSASLRGDRIVIAVEDTGVGMSEAQTANLFQLERRSTSAGTDGERGAGLGLLLCRDLAEWIGGELEVESQLGVGATFRLLLPAA